MNEAFTIGGHTGQVTGFIALINVNTPIMSFMPLTPLLATQKLLHARATVYKSNLLSSIMIEQTIIQAALASIEMFDGTKSKFETWTESIKNAVQILLSLN